MNRPAYLPPCHSIRSVLLRAGDRFRNHSRQVSLKKVSVAAVLWLPPLRDRLHLAYQTLVNGYFKVGLREAGRPYLRVSALER